MGDKKKTLTATIETHVAVSMRSYFSNNFISSAAFFARQALALEQIGTDEVTREQKDQDQGFVLGSIIFSVTFLEALVKEMAVDYSEERYHQYPKPENGGHSKIAESWNRDLYPTSILDRYQHTLMLADRPIFNTAENPYQNVNLLVKLRNSIIHYEPEDIDVFDTDPDEEINIHKMEARLKDKFPNNALYDAESYNYFPLKCFGHGCAEWSVQSAIAFANAFFDKLGISNHSQKRWNELETR
jgi:hypothetical protein